MANKFVMYLVIALFILGMILAGIFTANAVSDNPVKSAKEQATAAVIFAMMTPSITITPTPNGTPTPNLAEIGLTAAAQAQANQLKIAQAEQANQLAMAKLNQEVELEKIHAQQTADSIAMTATAERQLVFDGQTAIAIQTHGPETAVARTETVVAQVYYDQFTKTAIPVVQTVQWSNAINVSNAAEADSLTATPRAFTPIIVIIALTSAGMWALKKFFDERTSSRDEHGRSKTLSINKKGTTVVANLDRIPQGLFSVDKDGNVVIHNVADQGEQARTTERAQTADMLSALPPGREREAGRLTNNALGRGGQPDRIAIHGDGLFRSAINEADNLMMQEEA